MSHEPVLIATIAVGLSLAFVLGMVARRLRLPSLVGYLARRACSSGRTPSATSRMPRVATELAEIGVILLMFGVGIHFSVKDLLAVRSVAVPGALVQILVVTIARAPRVGVALGWGLAGGVVLGLSISVASTVVLLRAIIERGELDSVQGRVAVGWLIVEDLFTVVVLVLLPSIAPLVGGTDPMPIRRATVRSATWPSRSAGAVVVRRRHAAARAPGSCRWLLDLVARERSRELFVLAVAGPRAGRLVRWATRSSGSPWPSAASSRARWSASRT